MGCCYSIKQFEHTENNDWKLKEEFSRKRRRSEAFSRHHQNENLEDKQKIFQTYNYYYGGIPHPYTHRQDEACDLTAQGDSSTRTQIHYPLFTYQTDRRLFSAKVDPDDIEKDPLPVFPANIEIMSTLLHFLMETFAYLKEMKIITFKKDHQDHIPES